MPKSLATPANIKKRIKAYEELRTTSHWPIKCKLFGKSPRIYGGNKPPPMKEVSKPEVTELGRKLIGY